VVAVRYLEFLERLHAVLAPGGYLEIGVRHGDSLALTRGPAVGIDPSYQLRTALPEGVALYRETSDEYFARKRPLEPLGGRRVDLAFIDGMHLAEFVVRDFANVEGHAQWTSVVVFDDILPRTVEEAARDRRTRGWTGDVYKSLDVLETHRPDLICLRIDTQPTGLGMVLGLDSGNATLRDRYDDIVAAVVVSDPQEVPPAVLGRNGALDPEAVLSSSVWPLLRRARALHVPRRIGMRGLRRALRRDFG
jgi:Methyltransferase domain